MLPRNFVDTFKINLPHECFRWGLFKFSFYLWKIWSWEALGTCPMCHTAKRWCHDLNPAPSDSWIYSFTFYMKQTAIIRTCFFFKYYTRIQIYFFFLFPVTVDHMFAVKKYLPVLNKKESSLAKIDISAVCYWTLILKRDFSMMSIIWL